jgi:hypothetical protein
MLAGFGQYSIRNIDKPTPRSNEGWLRGNGAAVPINEASAALLE